MNRRPSVPGPRRRTCGGRSGRQRSERLAARRRGVFRQRTDAEQVFSGLAGSRNEWMLKLQNGLQIRMVILERYALQSEALEQERLIP